jgi:hypothetical protein
VCLNHNTLSGTNQSVNRKIIRELCLHFLISDQHDFVASMNLHLVSLSLHFVYFVVTCA